MSHQNNRPKNRNQGNDWNSNRNNRNNRNNNYENYGNDRDKSRYGGNNNNANQRDGGKDLESESKVPDASTYNTKPHDMRRSWNAAVKKGADGDLATLTAQLRLDEASEFQVLTNYLGMEVDPNKKLYIYQVDNLPDQVTRLKKRKMMEAMIDACSELRSNKDWFATDWLSTIVAWRPLIDIRQNDGKYTSPEIKQKIPDHDPRLPNDQNNGRDRELTFKLLRVVQGNTLCDFFEGRNRDSYDPQFEAAITIIINKAIQDKSPGQIIPSRISKIHCTAGHSSLNVDSKSAVKGYSFGFRAAQGSGLLNVNPVMSVFHEEKTVSKLLSEAKSQESAKRRLQGQLTGVRVRVEIDRDDASQKRIGLDTESRRTKTIVGFSKERARDQHAYKERNDKRTVWQHMNHYYGENAPHGSVKTAGSGFSTCVNLGGKASGQEQWYLAEDLRILPNQIYRGDMTQDMTSKMISQACRKPNENLQCIVQDFIPFLGLDNEKSETCSLADGMLKISPQLLTLPAHKAETAKVCYKGSEEMTAGGGFWDLRDQKFLTSDNRFKGSVYFLLQRSDDPRAESQETNVQRYMKIFFAHAFKNGLTKPGSWAATSQTFRTIEKDANIDDLGEILQSVKKDGADLAVYILPKNDKSNMAKYAAFKAAADQIVGIKSLCICHYKVMTFFRGGIPETIDEKNNSQKNNFPGYARNIAMKLNVRLGNSNHGVSTKSLYDNIPGCGGDKRDLMILGADVVHPSKEGSNIPSITAVVGSVDMNFACFRGSARHQEGKRELVEIRHMEEMVKERLQAWKLYRRRNTLPSKILYYRDGIDAGQFDKVREQEVAAIRHAWESVAQKGKDTSTEQDLKITTVVVTKRHHTRLYPRSSESHVATPAAGSKKPATMSATNAIRGNGNLAPGTVIDSNITLPYQTDFFLISHRATKGTARPAHYIVLQDQIGFSERQIQDLTYLLCYTYVRSTTSVSYVPAAYYADHLCERVKMYLRPIFENPQNPVDAVARMWARGGRPGGNPWREELDNTMFWM